MTPVYPCQSASSLVITPTPPPAHPHQKPTFNIPPALLAHLSIASDHLHQSRTVAFATETVYGLGASSLDPLAVSRVYQIKNRPSDNPLIVHVSSLDMLSTLLPKSYSLSPLYEELISHFWPGPLTLLFPSKNPPPAPAPQTNAIRMPSHPLALALIHHSNLPISAPSANSSGRPSPTKAIHVYNDLNGKAGLGCILDGGDCGVGLESTVVNGLDWKQAGGGVVDILRPGGLEVERIAEIVNQIDMRFGTGSTEIRVKGEKWLPNAVSSSSTVTGYSRRKTGSIDHLPPSTPGQKYRHYSPRVPVYLLLPSNTFPLSSSASSQPTRDPLEVVDDLVRRSGKNSSQSVRVGLLHFEDSPLYSRLRNLDSQRVEIIPISLGKTAESAAHNLFSGMLQLEGLKSYLRDGSGLIHQDEPSSQPGNQGVDLILVEGCSDSGLGLAFMERVGKSVGGGGNVGDVGDGEEGRMDEDEGRFWVQV